MFKIIADYLLGFDLRDLEDSDYVSINDKKNKEEQKLNVKDENKQKNVENNIEIKNESDIMSVNNVEFDIDKILGYTNPLDYEKKIYNEFIQKCDDNLYDIMSDYNSHDIKFTNKVRRKLKTNMMSRCNIVDNILKKPEKHYNSVIIGNNTYSKYVEELMDYRVIKNAPTKSFDKIKRKYMKINKNENKKLTIAEEIFIEAYHRYMNDLLEKKKKVKVDRDTLYDKIYEIYEESLNSGKIELSIDLKCQLEEFKNNLQLELFKNFDNQEYIIEDFKNSIVLCIDNSGSMKGNPIRLGCFYLLMLSKIFDIQEIYRFNSSTKKLLKPNFSLKDCSWKKSIEYIYTKTDGSTNLDSFITTINEEYKNVNETNLSKKNIIIFTDGDCDPINNSTQSPFNKKLNYNIVVVNLNSNQLCFPYTIDTNNICYIGGSNLNMMSGFIKSWMNCVKSSKPLQSEYVLNECLSDYKLNFDVNKYIGLNKKQISYFKKKELFNSFYKNF